MRLARFKFDSPSAPNTHTVETTMPPGLHSNLTRFESHPDHRMILFWRHPDETLQ